MLIEQCHIESLSHNRLRFKSFLGNFPLANLLNVFGIHVEMSNLQKVVGNLWSCRVPLKARKGTSHPTSQCHGSGWYVSNKVVLKARKGTSHPTSQCHGSGWYLSLTRWSLKRGKELATLPRNAMAQDGMSLTRWSLKRGKELATLPRNAMAQDGTSL